MTVKFYRTDVKKKGKRVERVGGRQDIYTQNLWCDLIVEPSWSGPRLALLDDVRRFLGTIT
jgi:hypothetical protein